MITVKVLVQKKGANSLGGQNITTSQSWIPKKGQKQTVLESKKGSKRSWSPKKEADSLEGSWPCGIWSCEKLVLLKAGLEEAVLRAGLAGSGLEG